MDSRAQMRAMLESARQSIRNRAANPTGRSNLKKSRTLEEAAASSAGHKQLPGQPTDQPPSPAPTSSSPDGLHFPKTLASGASEGGAPEMDATAAQEGRMQFVRHYHRLLLAFIEDKSKYELELPNLSALDRVVVHALAERCNLSHESAGGRGDRVMHLKKDILFFQHPEAARLVNLDDVVERVSWKESKFHIRYVRAANPTQVATGEIGSYGDEDALEKIERFRRATNEYRRATEMGYTQQELLRAEAGAGAGGGGSVADAEGGVFAVPGRLEEILSRPDAPAEPLPAITAAAAPSHASSPPPPPPSSSSSSPPPPPQAPTSTIAAAMARSKAAAAAAAAKGSATATVTVVYDEVCRTCGSRVRLDGPPHGWKCNHYCAHCTRQTIWSLEEVRVRTEPARPPHKRHRGSTVDSDGDGDADRRRHRHRGPAVEQIEREEGEEAEALEDAARHSGPASRGGSRSSGDDADDDGDALAVEDVVEMAATNDFSAKDMNWLREFASRTSARVADQVAFCIDFNDLTEASLFRRYETAAASPESVCWYVVLREVRALSLTVSDLLRELLSDVFAGPPSSSPAGVEAIHTEAEETCALDHLAVAFPNLSVYGTDCVVIGQLRPTVRWSAARRLLVNTDALQQLRQRYGVRHVFPTTSLEEAVRRASESATSSA
ncbi:R3H domain containing protein [Novymonas esmeraldas]|uniref:R3H domain containing protein n=1 Tax=Novymonas esmeraldas TaxID=1808958 RepID=A0AAW0EMY0_9TRYP